MSNLQPQLVTQPFCSEGTEGADYIIPPITGSAYVVTQNAGFPPLMEVLPEDGGVPVPRAGMNGSLRLYSSWIKFYSLGGNPTFATEISLIGGYDSDTILFDAATNRFVVSLIDENIYNFVAAPAYIDGVKWQFLDLYDGFKQAGDNTVNYLLQDKVGQIISVIDFGAKGDGVADDTAAIQNAINALCPYPYTPGFTNGSGSPRNANATLFFPVGKYKITSTILLNPNIRLQGVGSMTSNWSDAETPGGSIIIAGADITGFMFDNAPWTSSGVRQQNAIGTFAEYDGNLRQVCGNIQIENIKIQAGGYSVYGNVNIVNGLNSTIFKNAFVGADVGIRFSSTWLHDVQQNVIAAKNIGYAQRASTVGNVSNNHVIGSLTPNPSFNYALYPCAFDSVVQGYTKGFFFLETSNQITNNTIEGSNIQCGMVLNYDFGSQVEQNYMEALGNVCYASAPNGLHIKVGYTACPGTTLWRGYAPNYPNQPVIVDWSTIPSQPDISRLIVSTVAAAGSLGSAKNVILIASSTTFRGTLNQDLISKIQLPEYGRTFNTADQATNYIATNVNIYVSSTGSDTNYGLSTTQPVLTFGAALRIAILFNTTNVNIYLQTGETININNSQTVFSIIMAGTISVSSLDFKSTGSSANAILVPVSNGTNAGILNIAGTSTLNISFTAVNIPLPATSTVADAVLFRANNNFNVLFSNCTIVIATSLVYVNRRRNVNIIFDTCNVSPLSVSGSVFSNGSAVATLINNSSTITGITGGTGTFIINDLDAVGGGVKVAKTASGTFSTSIGTCDITGVTDYNSRTTLLTLTTPVLNSLFSSTLTVSPVAMATALALSVPVSGGVLVDSGSISHRLSSGAASISDYAFTTTTLTPTNWTMTLTSTPADGARNIAFTFAVLFKF